MLFKIFILCLILFRLIDVKHNSSLKSGYELLNNLIDIKLPKQKSINFPRGIFYKPESKISLKEDLIFQSNKTNKIDKNFKFKNFNTIIMELVVREENKKAGLNTLKEAALLRVVEGVTTVEEYMKIS